MPHPYITHYKVAYLGNDRFKVDYKGVKFRCELVRRSFRRHIEHFAQLGLAITNNASTSSLSFAQQLWCHQLSNCKYAHWSVASASQRVSLQQQPSTHHLLQSGHLVPNCCHNSSPGSYVSSESYCDMFQYIKNNDVNTTADSQPHWIHGLRAITDHFWYPWSVLKLDDDKAICQVSGSRAQKKRHNLNFPIDHSASEIAGSVGFNQGEWRWRDVEQFSHPRGFKNDDGTSYAVFAQALCFSRFERST